MLSTPPSRLPPIGPMNLMPAPEVVHRTETAAQGGPNVLGRIGRSATTTDERFSWGGSSVSSPSSRWPPRSGPASRTTSEASASPNRPRPSSPSASRPRPATRPSRLPLLRGIDAPEVIVRVDQALGGVRPLPSVTSVSPLSGQATATPAFATVQFDAITAKLPATDVQRVIDKAESYAQPDLQVALGGPPISAVVSPSPGSSEGIGITAAIIIMLLAFGSVVAMGLPIITALVGIGAGYGVVALISHLLIDPSFGPELMAMIGLGVGIDYALFIVTRYRQGLGKASTPATRSSGPCPPPGGPCSSPGPPCSFPCAGCS